MLEARMLTMTWSTATILKASDMPDTMCSGAITAQQDHENISVQSRTPVDYLHDGQNLFAVAILSF